jgi:hypothetical protein
VSSASSADQRSLTNERTLCFSGSSIVAEEAVYESVLVIDNEGLVHKVNEMKFMVITARSLGWLVGSLGYCSFDARWSNA